MKDKADGAVLQTEVMGAQQSVERVTRLQLDEYLLG